VTLVLRWTEHAANQLGAIAEYISVSSPVYAEQVVARIVVRLTQAQAFPESGRQVPEARDPHIREFIESPYRLIYRIREDTIEVIAVVHGRQDLASGSSI
jgi:addiction module RelE/StbE family toxin